MSVPVPPRIVSGERNPVQTAVYSVVKLCRSTFWYGGRLWEGSHRKPILIEVDEDEAEAMFEGVDCDDVTAQIYPNVNAPRVISTAPGEGQIDRALNVTCTVAFTNDLNDLVMDPDTITSENIFLCDADGDEIGPAQSSDPTMDENGLVTLHFAGDLTPATAYGLRVLPAVKDMNGLSVRQIFDTDPPTVSPGFMTEDLWVTVAGE